MVDMLAGDSWIEESLMGGCVYSGNWKRSRYSGNCLGVGMSAVLRVNIVVILASTGDKKSLATQSFESTKKTSKKSKYLKGEQPDRYFKHPKITYFSLSWLRDIRMGSSRTGMRFVSFRTPSAV